MCNIWIMHTMTGSARLTIDNLVMYMAWQFEYKVVVLSVAGYVPNGRSSGAGDAPSTIRGSVSLSPCWRRPWNTEQLPDTHTHCHTPPSVSHPIAFLDSLLPEKKTKEWNLLLRRLMSRISNKRYLYIKLL